MFTRPKSTDNEEDILAMQEAYLREKETNKDLSPSAKVINLRKHKSPEASTSGNHSKDAEKNATVKKSRVSFNEEASAIDDGEQIDSATEADEDKVYFPSVNPSVIGKVVEKRFESSSYEFKPSGSSDSGNFPVPERRKICRKPRMNRSSPNSGDEDSFNSSGSRPSSREDSLNMSMEIEGFVEEETECFTKSAILTGSDAPAIHSENVRAIQAMSQEEVLRNQQALLEQVDPKIANFVRSLRSRNDEPHEGKQTVKTFVRKLDMEGDSKRESSYSTFKSISDNEVVLHPDLKRWLHFDTFEADKLEWIQNIEQFHKKSFVKQPYEARFDFKGYLQPYIIEYTEKSKSLFHHGNEPHRPGYSLDELFLLCRSTVTQQRALALNTIAGILEYNSIGIYENVIDIPITKIYFVLRFALDENIPIILEPTLKALRNMFYNRIDEACLEFLLCSENGLIQPRLVSSKTEKTQTETDVSELKDFHLVDLDLVNGAIRTDLVPRLRYILTTIKPPFSCVEYCIHILTRIYRDSLENAESLFQTEGLMDYFFENHIPQYLTTSSTVKDKESLKLMLCVLKMLRVAVSQSKTIAELCCSKYDIFRSILNYIGNVVIENTVLLQIQIEIFYLWSCFINYGLGLSCLCEIKGVLLKVLDNHSKGTDLSMLFPPIMHSHIGALITLLTNARLAKHKHNAMLPDDYFEDFLPIMLYMFRKFSNQIGCLMSYTAGHLQSVTALLRFMSTMHELEYEKFNKITEITTYLQAMFQCDGFLYLASSLERNSNVLCTLEVKSYAKTIRDTNIPGLNSSLISKSQNVVPIVTVTSPVCFLVALSKYILISKNKRLYLEFIQHNVTIEYMRAVGRTARLNMTDNWFTKIELDFLCNLIQLSVGLQVSDYVKEIVYSISFKLSYILTSEYKQTLLFLLEEVVFNKKWFAINRLLRNCNIDNANSILNHLNEIFDCYKKMLCLNVVESANSLTASNWSQKVLPRDWIFMPILSLYSKSQELQLAKIPKELENAKENSIKEVLTCSLEWILVSELYFPEIANEITITARFCRLCCVFLCDNSLFLDPVIKPLLKSCIRIIFNLENSVLCSTKFDFNQNVLGINSFQDFYAQLVDQFQAVSYGDPTFAACILVPLAQKHDIKWRKLVWSEYAACLRALDCPQKYLCYKLEKYLNPVEMDFSLLRCYQNAIHSNNLRPGTIAFKIASSHLEYAKCRQRHNPK